jgi:hypothetical protein
MFIDVSTEYAVYFFRVWTHLGLRTFTPPYVRCVWERGNMLRLWFVSSSSDLEYETCLFGTSVCMSECMLIATTSEWSCFPCQSSRPMLHTSSSGNGIIVGSVRPQCIITFHFTVNMNCNVTIWQHGSVYRDTAQVVCCRFQHLGDPGSIPRRFQLDLWW